MYPALSQDTRPSHLRQGENGGAALWGWPRRSRNSGSARRGPSGSGFRWLRFVLHSFLGSGENIRKHFTVQVAAREHNPDALALESLFLFERARQRGGSGALGKVVRVLVECAHRLGNLIL